MQAGDRLGQAFIVSDQPSEPACPGDTAFDHPAPRQQHEAPFRVGQLDDLQDDAMGGGICSRRLTRVALIDVGERDVIARDRLDRRRDLGDVGPILCVRRGDAQRQQMVEGVAGEVDSQSLLAFVPVIACTTTTFGGALEGAAIENHGGWEMGPVLEPAQQDLQVMDHGFEYPSGNPALRLLIDRLPGREVNRQHPPGRPDPDDPAQGVVDLAEIVNALRGIGAHKGEIGRHERPLLIGAIGGIRFADRFRFHLPSVPSA